MAHQRWVLLTFVVGAVLLGMVVQAAVVSGFAQFAIPDNRLLGLVATSTALSLGVGAVAFFVSIRNRKWVSFVDETVDETLKVRWPRREEAIRGSTTVVMTTLFTALVLATYDILWKNLADLVLFTG